MIKHIALAAVAAAAMTTGSANASTVIFNPGVFGPPSGYTLYDDFNTVSGQAFVTGSSFIFPSESIYAVAADLPGNTTPYLVVLGGGVANVSFDEAVRSFSFDYNTLTISYADGGSTAISGAEILAGGAPTGSVSGSFIINGDGRLISGLSLATTLNSFEVDNLAVSGSLASAVPEPAT